MKRTCIYLVDYGYCSSKDTNYRKCIGVEQCDKRVLRRLKHVEMDIDRPSQCPFRYRSIPMFPRDEMRCKLTNKICFNDDVFSNECPLGDVEVKNE